MGSGFWLLGYGFYPGEQNLLGGFTNEAVAGESVDAKTLSIMEASSEQSLLE